MQFELRKSLRPKGHQTAVVRPRPDVGEVDLVAAHQQFDGEHAAAAERVDDARGDRLRGVERGARQLVRLPRLQRVTVGLRWPIGSQKCTAGPVGPVVRTVSSVISSSTSTTVSAITRLCGDPARRRRRGARPPRRRRRASAPTDPPPRRTRDRRDHQREARMLGDRAQLLDRTGEPERHGRQAEFVGGQPAQALAVQRSSRALRGVGNTSTARARRRRSVRPPR